MASHFVKFPTNLPEGQSRSG